MNISVALCTHNGAAFIEAQLRSIFTQTEPPSDIVVSDDASSDETLEIVRRTVAEFRDNGHPTSTVILENATALGVVANFEKAVSATVGDFVALCDQDDLWSEDKLETLIGHFYDDDNLSLVHSNALLVDADGDSLGITLFEALAISPATLQRVREGEGFAVLMRRNIVTGATVLFRRELLNFALPFPQSWVHDEWLAVVAAAVGEITVCNQELISYRQHEKNQIGATSLTLKGRLAKLQRTRTERNRILLARSRELAERLQLLGGRVDPSKVLEAQEKVEHEVQRSALPEKRLARFVPIIREVITGRYQTMGSGASDILRDLVQPSS